MGVKRTVLLSAGSVRGLDVSAGSNDDLLALVRQQPAEYCFFANERPDRLDAVRTLEKYLRLGAAGIGEQKFHVDCDSVHIDRIAEVAREFRVPVLFHFEFDQYNTGFERLHQLLKRHPAVNFVGHAQTWWGHIDREHKPWVMMPRGPVAAGGITDRLLSDYPNIYGDLSANSGLNALLRDEGHAREFLLRHQDRLLYGSDCADSNGHGTRCTGAQILSAVEKLVADQAVRRKILFTNAERLLAR
jgi:predicted TIM-barrel fold metal-dependent hydrolase